MQRPWRCVVSALMGAASGKSRRLLSCRIRKFPVFRNLAGDLMKLYVPALRDAIEGVEGGIFADVVALHEDAFGLADDVAVEQGGPEMVCSLGLSKGQRGQRGEQLGDPFVMLAERR
jgi:hypothetical protein